MKKIIIILLFFILAITFLQAQNVEKIVPEAVNEKDGYKGVDYARLVPLLIEAIKEQNKKMEDQQKQIDEKRKMIEKFLKNSV